MKSLNRRTLLSGAAAASVCLAFGTATRTFAQPVDGDRTFTSVLTDSVIELVGPDWNFDVDSYQLLEANGTVSEYLSISKPDAAVEIEFVDTSSTPEEYLENIQGLYQNAYASFEVVDSGSGNDGAWFAGSAANDSMTLSVFCEYQAGAYENADLVVIVNSQPGILVENLSATQEGILIGELEPMVMIESSGVEMLAFPGAGSTSTRQTRTSTTETNSTTSSDSEYVETLKSRRAAFMDSFELFAESFAVLGGEDSTDPERETAMLDIDAISDDWATYAGQAADFPAPPEFAELETLYVEWAEGISEMGYLWMDVRNGDATLDDFFAQVEIVGDIDITFNTELKAS